MRAQQARFRAHLAAAHGEQEAVQLGFKTASGIFREFGLQRRTVLGGLIKLSSKPIPKWEVNWMKDHPPNDDEST